MCDQKQVGSGSNKDGNMQQSNVFLRIGLHMWTNLQLWDQNYVSKHHLRQLHVRRAVSIAVSFRCHIITEWHSRDYRYGVLNYWSCSS